MTSIRRRTLTLIIGLLLGGFLLISALNLHDSNHEIAEVYDAQLAQNARLLQGLMSLPLANEQQADLYRAFNKALAEANPKVDGHPYESKVAFQVWSPQGERLVFTSSAPTFATPPEQPGYSNVDDLNGRQWRGFLLKDKNSGLRIFVGQGWYDFATPFFAAEYSLTRTGFPRDRIQFHYYDAGHMMYVRAEDRTKLSRDIRTFIQQR